MTSYRTTITKKTNEIDRLKDKLANEIMLRDQLENDFVEFSEEASRIINRLKGKVENHQQQLALQKEITTRNLRRSAEVPPLSLGNINEMHIPCTEPLSVPDRSKTLISKITSSRIPMKSHSKNTCVPETPPNSAKKTPSRKTEYKRSKLSNNDLISTISPRKIYQHRTSEHLSDYKKNSIQSRRSPSDTDLLTTLQQHNNQSVSPRKPRPVTMEPNSSYLPVTFTDTLVPTVNTNPTRNNKKVAPKKTQSASSLKREGEINKKKGSLSDSEGTNSPDLERVSSLSSLNTPNHNGVRREDEEYLTLSPGGERKHKTSTLPKFMASWKQKRTPMSSASSTSDFRKVRV